VVSRTLSSLVPCHIHRTTTFHHINCCYV
jgi:hypothetical protein